MSSREPDPLALDVMAFCRDAKGRLGQLPLAAMPRLAGSLFEAPATAAASWSAQGGLREVAGSAGEIWLHLKAQLEVRLQCQRCLQSMTEALRVDRDFRFVRSEAEALRLDEDSDDDVLVLEPRFDLGALIEDELILGLPLVPRHLQCPQPLLPKRSTLADDEPAPHPFAALAALRSRPPRDDS